ncbi:MAG TPA: hypothetical protein VK249_30355, partial [Anaerolineales bacterium]|nr:hypothetical protein [Anaerolineales bacterium]
GRSTVMGAELVSSVLMSRSKYFDKFSAYTGILSGLLLLAGDIGAALAPSALLTVLMGVGYVLLTTWFFLTGCRLLQFGQDNARS